VAKNKRIFFFFKTSKPTGTEPASYSVDSERHYPWVNQLCPYLTIRSY